MRDASHQSRLEEAARGQVLCAALGEAALQQCLSARALYFCPVIIRKAPQEELGITEQTAQSCRKPGFGSWVAIRFCSCPLFCRFLSEALKQVEIQYF